MNRNTKFIEWFNVFYIISPGIVIAIMVISFVWQECVPKPKPQTTIPVEEEIKWSRIFSTIQVVDSTGNGFEITYHIPNATTEKEFQEILSRKHIHQKQQQLKEDAPQYFDSLLEADIYDFGDFAITYDVDSIKIKNIFIYGEGKYAMYSQPHPEMENCATEIDKETRKGAQFIDGGFLYNHLRLKYKVYEYWMCKHPYSYSLSDERYIHF
ncbi:MAG: hypothetical protein LUG98_15995 [Tannerellaceae bacterium]|nr:hypothetical protein [Tannerellaceae bacterium]